MSMYCLVKYIKQNPMPLGCKLIPTNVDIGKRERGSCSQAPVLVSLLCRTLVFQSVFYSVFGFMLHFAAVFYDKETRFI